MRSKQTFILQPGQLSFEDLAKISVSSVNLKLEDSCWQKIEAAHKVVVEAVAAEKNIYGVTTGFGKLAETTISHDDLHQLQRNLILSHSTGVGEYLSDDIVRLILLLKINSLAQGYSGVRRELLEALIALFNAEVYPCIPSQGSVGASGDLAPLAHMAAVLLGEGEVRYQDDILPAHQGLREAGLIAMTLHAKEGLALINGTEVSTAIALKALFELENIFSAAIYAGCLTLEAVRGDLEPFTEELHAVRRQESQQQCAKLYRDLLEGSSLVTQGSNKLRVQDPYSLRCQPQVMGACLAHIRFVKDILLTEANAVNDNPLIFSETNRILSGGNFHGEPVAMAADTLALAIAEIGALAERRIALLIDSSQSLLPAFLIENSGLNSGFMIVHVTAAALASENKSLAYPASVDSIPTSANQEDHVSMATYAARRLLNMVENTRHIIAIELMAACQGIDLHQSQQPAPHLQACYEIIREKVSFCESDRFFAKDIAMIKDMIEHEQCCKIAIMK